MCLSFLSSENVYRRHKKFNLVVQLSGLDLCQTKVVWSTPGPDKFGKGAWLSNAVRHQEPHSAPWTGI